jgi:hypothetical protein
MARIIEEVAILIGADTRGLDKGMKKTQKRVNVLTRSFKRLGATLITAFGARALFRGFSRTLSETNAIIKTAKGVSFSVAEWQRLIFALSQVGVEASAARIALGDFQKRLAKPQFAKFFRMAGLDPEALRKMKPAEAFASAFKHLSTLVDDPRAAKFFGEIFEEQAGKNMLKAARQMGEMQQAERDFDAAGGGLSKRHQNRIERLNKETLLWKLSWESLKTAVLGEIGPDILRLMREMREAGLFKDFGKGIIRFFDDVSEGIETTRGEIDSIKTAFEKFGEVISDKFGMGKTPEGEETPQETGERFASMTSAERRRWLTTPTVHDTPMITATRLAIQRKDQEKMSITYDVNVTADNRNNQKLAEEIVRAAKKKDDVERRISR